MKTKKVIKNICDFCDCKRKATHIHKYFDDKNDDFEVFSYCDKHEEEMQNKIW